MTEAATEPGQLRKYDSTTARVQAFRERHEFVKVTVEIPKSALLIMKEYAQRLRDQSYAERRQIDEIIGQTSWETAGPGSYKFDNNNLWIVAFLEDEKRIYGSGHWRWSIKDRTRNITLVTGEAATIAKGRRIARTVLRIYALERHMKD
jgi:hypothetical protein